MKLKCPKGCRVKGMAKFYRTWKVDMLADATGSELVPEETSWSTKDVFHCIKCHEPAEEVKA